MTKKVETILSQLQADGLSITPDVLSQDECDDVITRLEYILKKRHHTNVFIGNSSYQVVYNYFLEDRSLLSLATRDLCHEVMRLVIDEDYVLISPSARNRQRRDDIASGHATSGVGWHIDSRRIGGLAPEVLRPSPVYFGIIALDDLEPTNGATHFIPGSHKWYERPTDRNATFANSRVLKASAGSMIFMDSALWHKVGDASSVRRWAIFNMYGPWFMKPYFDFSTMFSAEEVERLGPRLRQVLHFDSLPPRDHTESTITLRRVREAARS